jgi:acyl-CoA synthetase (AMP-forming)/AMP-acid ligase II
MTTIDALLRASADRDGTHAALAWHGARLTYAALDAAVESCAQALRAIGVTAGDRVAIVGGNSPAAVVVLFATWRAGAVAVPINDRLRTDDRAAAFEATDPTVTATFDPSATLDASDLLRSARLERVSQPGDDGDVVPGTGLILTTSGSTGTPKPVLVSHQRELDTASSLTERLAMTADDVTVLAVSSTHAFGLSCLLTAIASGGEVVLVDSTTSTAPLFDALGTGTVLHGSPTLFTSLVSGPRRFPPQVRTGLSAGAAAPPGLLERLDDAGLTILNLYGMTELGATTATRSSDAAAIRWTTSGSALPGHELRVVDGELHVRGAHVTAGYHRQPERTAAAFSADGWFRTGDVATLDPAGNLTVLGRLDDVVSVAGFTVSPAEVETCLLGHPDVREAVVVATPDARLGHRLRAYVVRRAGATIEPRELVSHVRQRLAGYKVPYRVEFMDDLPRVASGKPDRQQLRARATEAER